MALRSTRQKYNEAVQQTTSEQLLLNLVRLRYRDPAAFLELTSLSTQFVFSQAAFANANADLGPAKNILNIGGAIGAEQRPTVTYDPLQGHEFVTRLVSPMSVETAILLIRSGWSTERVLRLTIQRLNGVENARTASGPTPELAPDYLEFLILARNLRTLQLSDDVDIGYETNDRTLSGILPRESLKAEDFIAAAKSGWKIQPRQEQLEIEIGKITETNEGQAVTEAVLNPALLKDLTARIKKSGLDKPLRVRIEKTKLKTKMQLNIFQEDALRFRACQAAGLTLVPCIVEYSDDYVLTQPVQSLILRWDPERTESDDKADDKNPEKRKTNQKQRRKKPPLSPSTLLALKSLPNWDRERGRYELKFEPRSLMGTLYFVSHAIEVPPDHVASGLVTTTLHEWGEPFDWNEVSGDLLKVHSQKKKPKSAAVAVKFRGYWFYIDDRNLASKSTFALLLQLFELQAGGGASGAKPVLTLSIGS
ncbi:MAG: ParB N-terminal domain-containing protein [Planctomycetes bacterium]|nr:ParB N-terminal domain-containing protein [Planctomycetota bacterium]